MSTQHPDNACAAYWCNKSFINTADEIEEAYIAFNELGCDEYMWDWEGKFVDEAVIDKLFRRYTDYFKKHPLGKEKFLTYRIPNIWEEPEHRLMRPFINIATAEDLAREFGFHAPPIIEIILPMTKSADQILYTEAMFRKVARLKREILTNDDLPSIMKKRKRPTKNRTGEPLSHIGIIPLVERVEDLIGVEAIVGTYLKNYEKTYKKMPEYLRPFIARSDPALNAGLIPAVLASKVAISEFARMEDKYGVPMHPIIGTGSLPFRGGVNPENIKEVIDEYDGIRTLTIQSAFKYDYPMEQVKEALSFIAKTLPKRKPLSITAKEIAGVKEIHAICGAKYKGTVEALAPLINRIAAYIPARRERMLHIGLFGYSRGVGKVSLPRAITFTGAFYSMGIPPEFIGTGRALRKIQDKGLLPLLKKLYINLERDLIHAGKYLNKETLAALAKRYPAFNDVIKDIQETENILGVELGPIKPSHFLHRNLVSNIYHKLMMNADPSHDIVEAAKIRKSLG